MNTQPGHRRQAGFVQMFRGWCAKLSALFEPEEVEVTFMWDGKRVVYFYTDKKNAKTDLPTQP